MCIRDRSMRPVVPPVPVISDSPLPPEDHGEHDTMEYENPSHNPFAFIQAVKSGSADFLEFVYLRPRVMGKGERSPYNLEVTPSSAVERDDFYTLGLSGVTHFCNGKAEFTPLERWQREFRLYARLKKIGFFQKYRRWKSYFCWRKQVCTNKMRAASSQLSDKLFFLSPILRSALLVTRRLCQEIEHNELHRVQTDPDTKLPTQTYTLDAFIEEQMEQKREVQESLGLFSDQLVVIVSGACEQELDKKFPIETKPDETMGSKLTSLGPGMSGSMMPTSQGMGGGAKMSYTEISTKRAECRKLTNFIRLCDYLVGDTLRELAYKSTKDVLQFVTPVPADQARIQKEIAAYQAEQAVIAAKQERQRMIQAGELEPDEDEEEEEEQEDGLEPAEDEQASVDKDTRKKTLSGKEDDKEPSHVPLFVSELILDTDAHDARLHFVPDKKKFSDAVNSILNSFLDTVGCVGNLVQRHECRPFTAPQFNDRPEEPFDIGEGVDIRMLIQEDTVYELSLIHISEPTRLLSISYAVFCLKKKKKKK
eukprot:TRINITY_DN12860_c0_g3_i2.p1 TRINITY_DN12860_c0_g3~~TRINITY_DN12860_c0_g3_i2.p1  ORF type:complete len:536 (-),score=171.76 TRINITY_DN12860_c0_g3_i2:61-1668(-)